MSEKTANRERDKWVHEDQLINHRLTWLIASQSLLFAGYGLLVQKEPTKRTPEISELLVCFPWLGTLTSAAILLGILGAMSAMVFIAGNADQDPDIHWITTGLGWLAAVSLPTIFLVSWITIITANIAVSCVVASIPIVYLLIAWLKLKRSSGA
ncbi:MAG: hypothetical protein AAGH40_07105 [Verrucomicrobiota bacterium]